MRQLGKEDQSRRKTVIPDVNCELMLRPFFNTFLSCNKEESETLLIYTCRLISEYRKILHPSVQSQCNELPLLPFWGSPCNFSPCVYALSFVCICIKLCFGLDRSNTQSDTHPKWAQYFLRMNEQMMRSQKGILIDNQPIRIFCEDDRLSLANFLRMAVQEKTFQNTLLRSSLNRNLFLNNNLQAGIKTNTALLSEMNIKGLSPLVEQLNKSFGPLSFQNSTSGVSFPSIQDMKKRASSYRLHLTPYESSLEHATFDSEQNAFTLDYSYLLQSISWFVGCDPLEESAQVWSSIGCNDEPMCESIKNIDRFNYANTFVESILLGIIDGPLAFLHTRLHPLHVNGTIYRTEPLQFSNVLKRIGELIVPYYHLLYPENSYRRMAFQGTFLRNTTEDASIDRKKKVRFEQIEKDVPVPSPYQTVTSTEFYRLLSQLTNVRPILEKNEPWLANKFFSEPKIKKTIPASFMNETFDTIRKYLSEQNKETLSDEE